MGAGEDLLVVFRTLCSRRLSKAVNTEVNLKRDSKQDEIGVCVFPSTHAKQKGDLSWMPSDVKQDSLST